MYSLFHRGAIIGLIFLAIGLGCPANGQNSAPEFFLRSWSNLEGLPNSTVNAITQTRDGYLWLGTDEGLARFDGVHFRIFGAKDGLKNLQISALTEAADGGLWIGTTGGGLARMFRGEIKTYTKKDGLVDDSINTLLLATNGDLWIGTPVGMSCLRNETFLPVDQELTSVYIASVVQDHSGDIWIAEPSKGLFRSHQDKLSVVLWPQNMPNHAPHIPQLYCRRLMVDNENRLWMGMVDRAVNSLDLGSGIWHGYGPGRGMPHSYPNCLAETPDGVIWVGTLDKGLYYLPKNGTRFLAVRPEDGLPDSVINSIFSGAQQPLWIGTQSGGLTRLSPRKIFVYQATDGTNENRLCSLAQCTNGDLWVGTYGQGVYRWQTNGFKPYSSTLDKPASSHLLIEAVLGASDGSLWWGAGPSIFQSKNADVLLSYDNDDLPWLEGNRVLCLCENHGGGMWVGTFNGQLELINQENITEMKGLSGKPVTDLVQATNGTLWIGSLGGGLARWQNGELTTFTTKDGLLSDSIRALYLDADGILWIGTDGGGLNRWANGKMIGFTTQTGLPDNVVLQILDDDNGGLWLGCPRGICRLSKQSLSAIAAGQPIHLRPFLFDTADGMVSQQCIGNFSASLKTKSGRLCFLTVKGIVTIDPRQISEAYTMPTALLEEVVVDDKSLPSELVSSTDSSSMGKKNSRKSMTTIPPGRHSIEFHYTGIEFNAPEKIQFRYQLAGWDPKWNEAGNTRSVTYNGLSAGTYHFHVQCRTLNGQWNEPGVEMPFIVQPYFWQEPWFQIFTGVVLIYIITMGIRQIERRRYRIRLKRIEQEQAMEQERGRIASDLHDELGANLTHISILSEIGQATPCDQFEKLKKRMERISRASVETVRSLDEIVWAVNPRNDSLRSLVLYLTQFARGLFEDTGIQCLFQIEENLPDWPLPPEMRHNLFLVAKESLNNALKYSKATEISLNVTASGGQIAICVQDNGSGFCLTTVQSTSKRYGLGNMRKRIEALGGQFVIETIPGKGTSVRLTVKYLGLPTSNKKNERKHQSSHR